MLPFLDPFCRCRLVALQPCCIAAETPGEMVRVAAVKAVSATLTSTVSSAASILPTLESFQQEIQIQALSPRRFLPPWKAGLQEIKCADEAPCQLHLLQ